MKRHKAILSSLHTIYRLTTTSGDLKNFSTGICRLLRSVFGADKIIMLSQIPSSSNFFKIRLEDKGQFAKKGGFSILTTVEKEVLRQNNPMLFPNRLIAPFIFLDTLGAIYVRRKPKLKPFDEIEKAWFLSLCEQVSISLKILHLYQEQHKMMLNYVKSLSEFLTQNVPTSYLHTQVITWLIRNLGRALKMSETEIKALERAALLHDAGKIKLPSRLLKKQSPLTDDEFKLITKHPRKGVELIKNLEILKPVIPIILHHHERWDGEGYPSRLKKEKIPLGSRILAILDTFDAMHFGRPYKKRHTLEQIKEEFKKQKGRQFDPKIVDIFLKILKRKGLQKYLKFPKPEGG